MGRTKVVIGVVVAAVVVVAIVVPCVLLIPSSLSNDGDELPTFPFEDIWSSKYNYKSIYPSWDLSTEVQTDFLTMNDKKQVVRRDVSDSYNDLETLAPAEIYDKYNCNGYSVSPDAKFIYYRYNYTKVWRHSYTADYAIWDVENKKEIAGVLPNDAGIQHMEWSPSGHKLAFVHDFDVKLIVDLSDPVPAVLNVSSNKGDKNVRYNGIPDWMYEEEMISAKDVLYWSPNGTKIAYLETNEDNVQKIEYTFYGDGQYPETIEIAYPKAGTEIANVKFWVYSIPDKSNYELPAPFNGDHYFSRFTWKDEEVCLPTWTNRVQNTSIATICSYTSGTGFDCTNMDANMEAVDGGWVGSFGPFNPKWKGDNSKDYFTIYARPNDYDPSDGFWQLAYIQAGSNTTRWMTKTSYDIVDVTYVDIANQYVYFTAAYNEPRRRHILRVKSDKTDVTEPECVTCNLLDAYPDRCGWITPTFNADGSGVVINCRGYWVPLTLYIEINADGSWGKRTVMEDNQELQDLTEQVQWPTKEYGRFPSTKYSDKAYNYELWKPADFNENEKYPLLIEVYAGPEFQKVQDVWRKGFAQTYMVSTRKMIVVSVDGRGSAYEGYKFMRQVYMKLGQFEPEDQTDFAKYLLQKHSFLDKDNVAVWGWSYGGYTTSHTLGYDNGNTFKCGVAVAPLGDWRWYDAMYAERYMRTPDENDEGYTKASIVTGHKLENFKNSWYVLIHGTADDNVHFQSAAEMEKALVEADVDFDDFFYADQAHSINIGNANKHIYRQIDLRLSQCLGRAEGHYPA